MFIRKVRNRSGSIGVQIISKKDSKYKVVESLGLAKEPEEIEKLWLRAQIRIRERQFANQQSLFVDRDELAIKVFLENLANSHIQVIGPELILGVLFDKIGFNQIPDKFFRHLVITRLVYPGSKLKTVDYLQRYKTLKYQ